MRRILKALPATACALLLFPFTATTAAAPSWPTPRPAAATASTAPLPPGATKTPGHACYSTIQPPDGQGCPQPSDGACLSGDPRLVGECMAARRGWFDGPATGDQWSCLDQLWGADESGWDPHAVNRSSGAGGIPQALPPSKMGADWWDNVLGQIGWGADYIGGRYGSPCGALGARLSQGWY